MEALGSSAHRAIIGPLVARYQDDDRVRAVAVFGSIATGGQGRTRRRLTAPT